MRLKSQDLSFRAHFALSALADKDREVVEKQLGYLSRTKTIDFKKRVIMTRMGRPDRHVVRLSNHLWGVVSRKRRGLRVHDIFDRDSVLAYCRGLEGRL